MMSKKRLVGWLAVCSLMGLVLVPAIAGKFRPNTGGHQRWQYFYEEFNPGERPRVEDVQTVARMEEGDALMKGAAGTVEDTTRAVGSTAESAYRTVGDSYTFVVEGMEVSQAPSPAKPAEHTDIVEGTVENVTGTVDAAGRTVEDGYTTVVEGKEVPKAPSPAEPAEHTGLVEGTAENVTGTADAAGRTVEDTYASVVEGKEIEPVQEAEAEEHCGLIEGTWENITGTVNGIFAIFSRPKHVSESEEVPMGVPPAEPPVQYRYYPRYHGRVGRWLPVED